MRVATAEFSDGSKGPILIVDDRYVDLREYGFNDVRAVLESMTVDPHEILRIGEKADGTHELKLVKIKAPIERPGKLLCLGLNYLDHARELGFEIPREPIVFAKAPTAIIGPEEPIVIPSCVKEADYEAEMAIVIGVKAKNVKAEEAYDVIAGYTAFNDVSARDHEFRYGGQWFRGKSFDTFAPLGPYIVSKEEIRDPHSLDIELRLNGQVMQKSTTRNMIFKIPEIIEFISQGMTLEPGDVIATGTPPGVGLRRKPPVFLKHGDVIEVFISKIGVLRNPVVFEGQTS